MVICFLNLKGAVYLETYLYLYSAEQEPPKKEKKKHMSTFQIYACNYLNSFTQIVNIDSEITQRNLELLENLHVFRQKIIFSKLGKKQRAHAGPKQGSPWNVKKGKYLKVLAGLIIFRFNK